MPTPEQVLTANIDAYNAHDLEAYLATFTPSATFGQLGGRTLLDSRDAMRGFYKQFFEARPSVRCEIRQRAVMGSFVVDLQEISDGAGAAQPPMRAMLISEVDPADPEGRIKRVWYSPVQAHPQAH